MMMTNGVDDVDVVHADADADATADVDAEEDVDAECGGDFGNPQLWPTFLSCRSWSSVRHV